MRESPRFLKLVMPTVMAVVGVVISPTLRIGGVCPMAHLINIVYAVLLGPGYAFACAFTIGVLHITLMGIPPLAPAGAIFGTVLSGILYRLSGGKLIFAVIGEIVGTGIIGALVSYPAMTLLVGKQDIDWAFYIPLFLGGTLIGSSITFVFLSALAKTGILTSIQKQLGAEVHDRSHRNNIHNVQATADSTPCAA